MVRTVLGDYDATLVDNANVTGPGITEGYLTLDGDGDYAASPFVHNPADGAFSIFMWIKDGGSGQAIVSQADSGIAGPNSQYMAEHQRIRILNDNAERAFGRQPSIGLRRTYRRPVASDRSGMGR